jgi:hypothetical protein
MQPNERRETGEQDLFRSRLDQIIDLQHALVRLSLLSSVAGDLVKRASHGFRAARRTPIPPPASSS